MDKLYKFLIVFGSISYVIWFFQPYNIPEIYDVRVFELLGETGYGSVDILWNPIVYILLILYLLSAVGMWFYIKVARNIFLLLQIVYVALAFIGGVVVQSPIDSAVYHLIVLSDGALLFMAYFSSISERYENS